MNFSECYFSDKIMSLKQKILDCAKRDLSKKTGITQSVIARIEKCVNSPQTNTLIKLLYPMGYTLKVVPLDEMK